jgi:hypothetical protein
MRGSERDVSGMYGRGRRERMEENEERERGKNEKNRQTLLPSHTSLLTHLLCFLRLLKPPGHRSFPQQGHAEPLHHEVERNISHCFLPRLKLLHHTLLDRPSERDGDGVEGNDDTMGVLDNLGFGRNGEALLKGGNCN